MPPVRPPLRDYQAVARDHLLSHPRAALFLDMGLGKTRSTLEALTPEHLPVLVTAPKRVAENVWQDEVSRWRPDLTIKVAAGAPAARTRALAARADITVIGRDNLADAVPLDYATFVIDELSGFKTRASNRWKTARQITRKTPHVWGLTGTPSPNGLMDLWAQVYLLDGGARLGPTLGGFRNRFYVAGAKLPNGVVIEWIPRAGSAPKIHSLIDDICLSMTDRVELPETTYNTVTVPLLPATRALYHDMKDDLVAVIGIDKHTAANNAIVSSKLSQISAGFMYVDDADLHGGRYNVLHREKIRAVQEIVEGTGSPVLVAYQYIPERDMIREALGDLVHDIDEPRAIARWNAGELPVLLAHPSSAGHGLNLQLGPGHTIVWASLTWNLEEWEQFNRRLSRPGQNHPVVIHSLVSPRTVDTAKQLRLAGKATVQEALLEHLESPL